MKQTAIIIAALLLMCSLAFGQQGTHVTPVSGDAKYLQITLTNTGADTVDGVYILWPMRINGQGWYISETAPTKNENSRRSVHTTGDAYLCIEPNGTSGADDSLRVDMKPLVWDPIDEAYDIIEDDVTYLKFGSAGTYTQSTRDYLDFTDGQEYAIPLGGLLPPCNGVYLNIQLGDEGTCNLVLNIWLMTAQ
jgi:hypothetical protein